MHTVATRAAPGDLQWVYFKNEWMKWLLVYQLSSGQWAYLKAVHSTYHRLTDGPPTWVEQSNFTWKWADVSEHLVAVLIFEYKLMTDIIDEALLVCAHLRYTCVVFHDLRKENVSKIS